MGGALSSLFDFVACAPIHAARGAGFSVNIDDYFLGLERRLRKIAGGQIAAPVNCLASDDDNGVLRCRVSFWDGSYLDIYEVATTELGYPVRVYYAYTYLREGVRVFRYDNAPHHPEIITHPHHKHIGPTDRLAPADPPALSQVLEEVDTWLRKNE